MYLNSIENAERNNCKAISFYEGDASLLTTQKYDVIIANINRNILLADMKTYTGCLLANGVLLLSGFTKKIFQLLIQKFLNMDCNCKRPSKEIIGFH